MAQTSLLAIPRGWTLAIFLIKHHLYLTIFNPDIISILFIIHIHIFIYYSWADNAQIFFFFFFPVTGYKSNCLLNTSTQMSYVFRLNRSTTNSSFLLTPTPSPQSSFFSLTHSQPAAHQSWYSTLQSHSFHFFFLSHSPNIIP